MSKARLHLRHPDGGPVSQTIEGAIELAHRWVVRDFPRVDPALIADWAENVAFNMAQREDVIRSPQRFAYTVLRGKVCDFLKTGTAREESFGLGGELERISGTSGSFEGSVHRKILFDELKAVLNERDRYILFLLLEDQSSPATVAQKLGTSYNAAAKAIQRVKERIAFAVTGQRERNDSLQGGSTVIGEPWIRPTL